MHGNLILPNDMTMKKTKTSSKSRVGTDKSSAVSRSRGTTSSDDMRSHYDFDYSKSRPNRFAKRFTADTVVVILDPDVAGVFQSSESVNASSDRL